MRETGGNGSARWPYAALFLLYIAVVLLLQEGERLQGDEGRYRMFAEHLVRGHYSPAGEINLWSGPGYPLLLAPFIWLDTPYVGLRLCNAVLLIGMVLYVRALLAVYLPRPQAGRWACAVGLYPPFLYHLPFVLTETLAVFLVAGFAHHFCCAQRREGRWRAHGAGAALCFAGLALTKVLFGYVLIAGLVVVFLVRWERRRARWQALGVFVGALLLCSPYLVYTYRMTGKVFYWSNAGGLQLYWMTSPFAGDRGDWHSPERVAATPALRKNHGAFFDRLARLPDAIARDQAMKQKALERLRAHPMAFAKNWGANVSRMLFGAPVSHRPKPWPEVLAYAVPNLFLLIPLAWVAVARRRGPFGVPPAVRALGFLALVAFAASSLVSAYGRMLTPLVPLVAVWLLVAGHRLGGAAPPRRSEQDAHDSPVVPPAG